MSNQTDLPEMCVAVLKPGDILIGIKRGESGYFQMYDGLVKGEEANPCRSATFRKRDERTLSSCFAKAGNKNPFAGSWEAAQPTSSSAGKK